MKKRFEVLPSKGYYDYPQNVQEFVAFLQATLDTIPVESQAEAELEFSLDYETPQIAMSVWREETDAERNIRERKEADDRLVREGRERAEFERLKAKFDR